MSSEESLIGIFVINMNKKILIGAGVVALLLIVGGYFYFTQNGASIGQNGSNNNPFGTPGDSTAILTGEPSPSTQTAVGDVPSTVSEQKAGLIKISSAPVSDGDFFETKVATGTAPSKKLRFIERATGHIFEADLGSGSVSRISNTTIPKIEMVTWAIPGTTFLGQYINDGIIQSKTISIGTKATTSTTTVASEFVPITESPLTENILSSTFDQKGQRLFYLIKGGFGIEGYLSDAKGSGEKLMWEFPTTEWIAEWSGVDDVLLTSKAGNGIAGFAYLLNIKTKATSLVLADIQGLTTKPSPSGKTILYTGIEGSSWKTYVYSVKEKTNVRLPYDVVPEKCAWSSDELSLYCARPRAVSKNAPDDWYQGLVSFNDTLWKFDFVSGTGSQISELNPEENQYIDLANPHITSDETYLAFTNKKDFSFWAIPLK